MTVVVGGQSRNVGKTSIAVGLIAGLREMAWVAVKVTQYGHGVCSAHGEKCDCEADEPAHGYSLSEEYEAGDADSERFLAAGARRAFWLRTAMGELARAADVVKKLVARNRNVIFESNSVLELIEPDVYVMAIDPTCADMKASAERYMARADAFVISNGAGQAKWRGRPAFAASQGNYVSAELVDFVRRRAGRSIAESR